MSSRLFKKLRREIKASPKKAAVLGLLSVVGVWFWVPLVAKWFGKSDSEGKSVASAAPTNSPAPAVQGPKTNLPAAGGNAAVAPTKANIARRPWQQLLAWIEHDTRMAPASDLGSGRDPFNPIETKKPKLPATNVEKLDITPADAGLALSSTIVGGGQKTALIGRDVYREGDTIVATRGEGEFRLVEIRPREVVLERSGKLFRLGLPTGEWAVKSNH